MNRAYIRNFCIIAHIDHGKSTLADRLLELTQTVDKRHMQAQLLDSNPISRERGITIKLAPVRMHYTQGGQIYILNLIDTPGHVDFSYEVSRAMAACEGAVLLVDATVGIQAQTLTVFRQAQSQQLKIIPVLNKVDLPGAREEDVTLDMCESFGFEPEEVLSVSAKTGIGVETLVTAVIERIPAPTVVSPGIAGQSDTTSPLRALVFDSRFDQHKGVIADVRVFSGETKQKQALVLMAPLVRCPQVEVGIYSPYMVARDHLSAGEVGYIATGLKSLADVKVGDTITTAGAHGVTPLPGYQEPKPMVFLGLYPTDSNDFPDLTNSLEKLHLNDASFTYREEFSASLGKGYRVGFAGLLHAEIVQQRLEREFDLDLIVSVPSVRYQYQLWGEIVDIQTARDLPEQVEQILEPWLHIEIFTPQQYLGALMELLDKRRGIYVTMRHLSEGIQLSYELPMAELVTDFFDRLKSVTSGYASMDYEFLEMRAVDAVRLDILVHHERVDALSQIVVKDQAVYIGRHLVKKLKEVIPRQQFEVAVQAAIGGTIIARETIKAFRKDVTAKLYGGDRTRRMKLLTKQKKGKKRMKQFGKVSIPQEAFMAVIRREG